MSTVSWYFMITILKKTFYWCFCLPIFLLKDVHIESKLNQKYNLLFQVVVRKHIRPTINHVFLVYISFMSII